MRRSILVSAMVIGSFLFAPPAHAQQAGDKVVVISDEVEVKVGSEVIDTIGRGKVVVVREVKGEQIGIDSKQGTAFIQKRHVIPLSQAVGHWSGVIRTKPRDFAGYLGRGLTYFALQDNDKAIADYNEAVRLDPKQAAAYLNRGNALAAKGDNDKALADFNAVIRLDPKLAVAYYNRGNVWGTKGDNDKAIADYNEAIRLDPQYAAAYLNRGNLQGRSDSNKQIADYGEAIRLDPKFALAYYSRGMAWDNQGVYAKAIADYNEAVQCNPKLAAAYNNRAWIWATCPDARYRDGKQAVESATRLCELESWNDPSNLDTLSAAYAEAGDFKSAVKWQSKAVELAPASDKADLQSRVDLYRSGKPYREKPK